MRRLLPLFLLAGIALAAPPMNRAAFLLKHPSAVTAVRADSSGVLAYDPDGGGIVALSIIGKDRSLKVPGKLRSPLVTPEGRVLAVQLDFDRCQVAVWDVTAGRKVTALNGALRQVLNCGQDTEFIFSIQFTPDGRFLLTADLTGLRRWDARTGKLLRTLPGKFLDLHVSPDGRSVATVGEGYKVELWAADLSRRLGALPQQPSDCLRGSGGPWPGDAVWSPDSTRLAFSCDREVRVWNVAAGGLQSLKREGKREYSDAPNFSPDGRFVAADEDQFGVAVWRTGDGQRVTQLRLDSSGAQVTDVKITPQNLLLAAFDDGRLARLDLNQPGKVLPPLPLFTRESRFLWPTLAVSREGDRFAVAAGDGRVKFVPLPLPADWPQ
ncbi:hypothetical protein Dcar01_03648 [Deinococcus carri]|uniref:WD40 repeat domain-containing protein n=1 Tax=Deinococcus carri TaxID=1211323 RepID=A0ABP9WC28_9DEIO